MITIGKTQQAQAKAVTIVAFNQGVYRVQDDAGRITRAESAAAWPVGARVMVLAGQIIGRAGSRPAGKVYQV